MDRLIYTGLTAMQRQREAQAMTAHNLANIATPGFRREMAAVERGHLVPDATGAAVATRIQAGAESRHDLMRAGRMEMTGRGLDIMMDGGAWLAVEDRAGAEALTRRGDLRITADGRLVTGSGEPVLGNDGPIRLAGGFADLRIGPDGRIETRAEPQLPFVEVDRLKLVSPAPQSLRRGVDGLFRTEQPLAADPLASVTVGALELSNVESAAALVELVEQSRAFEIQTKLLQAARDMDERSAGLMRVEG
ncbi:flagellar basal body rod protein FlgF [Thermaurantiacus sp.]